MSQHTIWVIDDDRAMRWVLEKTFKEEGYHVISFAQASTALHALEQPAEHHGLPDVILSDIRMPGLDGLSFLAKVKQQQAELPVIIMTAHSDLESAVSSYQTGAFEYLPKPFDIDDALMLVKRALQHHARLQDARIQDSGLQDSALQGSGLQDSGLRNTRLQQEHSYGHTRQADRLKTPDIIGESPAMQEVFRAIGRLSQSHITVLINGESGTGKELVAHALHRHSPRKAKPFIALNMAAIPKDLIETELFGHEKGAFTGASTQRQGRFEQANGGTLFLDEIGDMPFETQTRLLRVLADGEFYRVGGHIPVKVDVRIIAATHQDLDKRVSGGHFREDLYHRLNVIRIHIPGLRERRQDIPMLASHFLARAGRELSVEPKQLRPETLAYMQQLPWPGNVRQLENCCRWLTVMVTGREVFPQDLPAELRIPQPEQPAPTVSSTLCHSAAFKDTPAPVPGNDLAPQQWNHLLYQWATHQLQQGEQQVLQTALPLFEQTLIEAALNHSQGRKRHAALLLGWGRNTLTRKLRELGMASADDEDS